MNRAEIEAKIKENLLEIESLKKDTIVLRRQGMLLSDEKQWFTEQIETIGSRRNKRTVLTGRVHWNENFRDDGTGDIVTLQRSQVVMEDGKWTDWVEL